MRSVILAVMACCLTACSDVDPRYVMESQRWGEVIVEVETRPAPVRPGMNEFLVIATTERGKPVYDMIISLRANRISTWQQGIQDGHSGVYRKAVMVPQDATEMIVQLSQHGKEEGHILAFPLIFEKTN